MVLGVRWGGAVLVLARRSRRVVEKENVTLMSCTVQEFSSKFWGRRSGRVERRRRRSLEPVG